MANKQRKGNGLISSQEAIERVLERLDFSPNRVPKVNTIQCRAPSCAKIVDAKYTRHGYCLACVKKATERKIRKQREVVELREMYQDDQFGAF